jgi:hypothetical protein
MGSETVFVNHGSGARTLREKGVLRNLSAAEQEVIIQSVMFHNAFSVPRKKSGDVIFFIKLIRDADKLDIWRVFLEYYESPDEQRASAVGLGYLTHPDIRTCTFSRL